MIYPNINAERSRHGLTLEAFANALGVNRKTIYNWMVPRGHSPERTGEDGRPFGCTIDYLLDNKHPTQH